MYKGPASQRAERCEANHILWVTGYVLGRERKAGLSPAGSLGHQPVRWLPRPLQSSPSCVLRKVKTRPGRLYSIVQNSEDVETPRPSADVHSRRIHRDRQLPRTGEGEGEGKGV